MPTKGYWVKKDGKELDTFEGWSDEDHPGYEFYTYTEYQECVEGRFWCPDAGYIKECYEGCYSGTMGLCSRKK